MEKIIRAKGREQVICQKKAGEVEYLTFPLLSALPGIMHAFSTRIGGSSEGDYATMNLSFTRGDDMDRVHENYRRMADALHTEVSRMVCTYQTHTTNIRRVYRADGGKGIIRDRDYTDVDGLVTDDSNLCLVCFTADCVPLYFVDVENGAIGLAHSGWRGTAAGMGRCMTERMRQEFGTEPEQLTVAIGPSICQDCYEVSEEVAEQFCQLEKSIPCSGRLLEEMTGQGLYPRGQLLLRGRTEGKYQLDLWLANLLVLRGAGIPLSRIQVTDVCTCCNSSYLFSHRASKGKRGNLAAFLMLKGV
ncbi:MAG: peptidoglycan editing factor PgeF [bacterium]|nr:peptidoglycan editing factor PgeF [bacterium]MCM1376278.1 peptidoglycan editing factor PgeF [Muribaculum sp.]